MADQPFFWLPALLGTALLEISVQEMLARKYVAAICFLAWTLVAFGLALYATINNWSQFLFISALQTPPLLPYVVVATVLTVTLVIFWAYRRDSLLKESALNLAGRIREFERECLLNSLLLTRMQSENEMEAEAKWQREVFEERIGSEIRALHDSFWRHGVEIDTDSSFLVHVVKTVPMRHAVSGAAEAVAEWADLIGPRTWIKRPGFFLQLMVVAAVFGGLWGALYSLPHWLLSK